MIIFISIIFEFININAYASGRFDIPPLIFVSSINFFCGVINEDTEEKFLSNKKRRGLPSSQIPICSI